MITGTADELKGIPGRYRCPEHENPLTVAWFALPKCFTGLHPELGRTVTATESIKGGAYVIRCGAGHYPEEVTRIPSLTEELKQGTLPDGPVKDNIIKKAARAVTGRPVTAATLRDALFPRTDLGTGNLLDESVVEGLKLYAYTYNLDPYRGHVCLYHGKPYITIDGYLWHGNQEHVNFSLTCRPLKPEERPVYQIPEGAHAWLATVTRDAGQQTFTGLGVVTLEEMSTRSKRNPDQLASPVVAAHPWQMAQKRAEWQALRRAFPIGNKEEVNP